jgi:hypothetical protein
VGSSLTLEFSETAAAELEMTVDLLKQELIAPSHRIEIIETQAFRYTVRFHPSQPKHTSDDKEPLIKDLLFVTPLKKGPLTIDLPQIARNIKRLIRKLLK